MTTDRIPLARRPADPHHAAVEDRLHVTLNDLASAHRAIRELEAERDQARAQLAAIKAEKRRILGRLEMAEHVIDLMRDASGQLHRALTDWDSHPNERPLQHVSVLGNCIACGSNCPNGTCPNAPSLAA